GPALFFPLPDQPARLLLVRAVLHLPDVSLEHGAVLGGHLLAQLLADALALLLGQLAPHVGDFLVLLFVHVPGAAGHAALGVLLRGGRIGVIVRRTAGTLTTVGSAPSVGSGPAGFFPLVLQFLDHLVETDEN